MTSFIAEEEEAFQMEDYEKPVVADIPKIAEEIKDGPVEPELATFPVTCLTNEGTKKVVSCHLLSQSRTFKNMCNNLGIAIEIGDGEEVVFPGEFLLGNISEKVFSKVVEWFEHHVGMPDPVVKENPQTLERDHFTFTDFEQRFLNVSVEELSQLLNAANFLDIPSLYLYACQRAAQTMSGKSCEEVRAEWGFPDDLTEEEKKEIRAQYPWCLG